MEEVQTVDVDICQWESDLLLLLITDHRQTLLDMMQEEDPPETSSLYRQYIFTIKLVTRLQNKLKRHRFKLDCELLERGIEPLDDVDVGDWA